MALVETEVLEAINKELRRQLANLLSTELSAQVTYEFVRLMHLISDPVVCVLRGLTEHDGFGVVRDKLTCSVSSLNLVHYLVSFDSLESVLKPLWIDSLVASSFQEKVSSSLDDLLVEL